MSNSGKGGTVDSQESRTRRALDEENVKIKNEKEGLLQELKQARMKKQEHTLQERLKQEKKRRSGQGQHKDAGLGPPPPPPPSRKCFHGCLHMSTERILQEKMFDEVANEWDCQW